MGASVRSRLGRAFVATVLLAGLAAAPVAAGGPSTLFVDDDGNAGPGCNGIGMAFVEIQAAVDAASPGDTIRVCPGTYAESIVVGTSDLTLTSTKPLGAVITVPFGVAGGSEGDVLLLIQGADRVVVEGFAFDIPAPVESTAGVCLIGQVIRAIGGSDGIRIVDNRLRAVGAGTLGPCGYLDGVVMEGGSSGRVLDNIVRDFQGEAISATGSTTFLDARRNIVRFWHLAASADEFSTAGSGDIGCRYGAGVVLANGARGRVLANEVVGVSSAGKTTPLICPGIYLEGAGDGIVVRNNLVRYAYDGINTDDTDEFTLEDNRFLNSRNDGLLVPGSRRATIETNLVRGSWRRGIAVPSEPSGLVASGGADYRAMGGPRVTGGPGSDGARNVTFLRNRSVDNTGRDCADQTSGSRTRGTANTWTGNRGDGNDKPNGICPA